MDYLVWPVFSSARLGACVLGGSVLGAEAQQDHRSPHLCQVPGGIEVL